MGSAKGVKSKHFTANGLVKSGPGRLHAISFSMSASGSVVLCDNLTYSAPKVIAVYTSSPPAGKSTEGFLPDFHFQTGLYFQKSGTVEHVNFSVE